jgi:hypothetical protein
MIVSSTPEAVLLLLQWLLAVSFNRASLSESCPSILVHLNPFSSQCNHLKDEFLGVFLGVSLVGSIGTMMGTLYTPVDKPVQKHLFWLVS